MEADKLESRPLCYVFLCKTADPAVVGTWLPLIKALPLPFVNIEILVDVIVRLL